MKIKSWFTVYLPISIVTAFASLFISGLITDEQFFQFGFKIRYYGLLYLQYISENQIFPNEELRVWLIVMITTYLIYQCISELESLFGIIRMILRVFARWV